jgi:hypothetical protein
MRIRIGSYNDKYWVETKRGFSWKRLPYLSAFIGHDWFYSLQEERDKEIAYYNDYTLARLSAEEYILHYSNEAAVYTEIKV